MDVPEKKAGSMDPVTVPKKTPDPFDVRAWALSSFCVTAFSLAVGYSINYSHALDHFHVPCSQFSSLPCETDAEEAVVNAIWFAMLFFVALLAALVLLTLRLPCRRRWVRRALACLVHALAIVAHCLYATATSLFLVVAHPGNLFMKIFWIFHVFLWVALGSLILSLVLLD